MFEKALPVLCLLAMLAGGARLQAQFPEAQITNGKITAKLYLPDLNRGYYRGTRFDWSGQISSLRTKNHEYFGQWFPRYDPQLHDSIMGPVEEFLYNQAALGDSSTARAPGHGFRATTRSSTTRSWGRSRSSYTTTPPSATARIPPAIPSSVSESACSSGPPGRPSSIASR